MSICQNPPYFRDCQRENLPFANLMNVRRGEGERWVCYIMDRTFLRIVYSYILCCIYCDRCVIEFAVVDRQFFIKYFYFIFSKLAVLRILSSFLLFLLYFASLERLEEEEEEEDQKFYYSITFVND